MPDNCLKNDPNDLFIKNMLTLHGFGINKKERHTVSDKLINYFCSVALHRNPFTAIKQACVCQNFI